MRLALMLEPVDDPQELRDAVHRWESIGLQELWRPDPATVVLGADGAAAVQVRISPAEQVLGSGPVFVVDSVVQLRALHPDLVWLLEPDETPVGRYAALRAEGGPVLRILDLTGPAPERVLFEDPAR